jgi:hypothetical protein
VPRGASLRSSARRIGTDPLRQGAVASSRARPPPRGVARANLRSPRPRRVRPKANDHQHPQPSNTHAYRQPGTRPSGGEATRLRSSAGGAGRAVHPDGLSPSSACVEPRILLDRGWQLGAGLDLPVVPVPLELRQERGASAVLGGFTLAHRCWAGLLADHRPRKAEAGQAASPCVCRPQRAVTCACRGTRVPALAAANPAAAAAALAGPSSGRRSSPRFGPSTVRSRCEDGPRAQTQRRRR